MPSTLFYPATLALRDLTLLVSGISARPEFDQIDFAGEQGGSADRQLAIPFLPDMDEIAVDEARLKIQAVSKPMDISGYTVSRRGGDQEGILLKLNDVSRLLEVEFTGSPLPALAENPSLRFVVRPVTASGVGPPIFAQPSFGAPGNGKMFGRVLAGLTYRGSASDRFVIGFPTLAGSQWLFQLATGDDATSLSPIAFAQDLTRVRVDAAPKNLTITLASSPPVALWSHPGTLLPDAGEQEISFTPLAQQHLAKALADSQVTLAVPLQFHSDSGGTLALTEKILTAHYVEHPLEADPTTLRLAGAWVRLPLKAPAGKRPFANSFGVSAKPLARELNAGSPVPDLDPPHDGVWVSEDAAIATSVPFLPRDSANSDTQLNLASVNVYLSAVPGSEVAIEVRPDIAGIPGPPAAPALVRKFPAGITGWSEFVLTKPLPVIPGGAPVWISLRANQGQVYWFGGGSGKVRSSGNRGETWSAASTRLAPLNPPLVQLFHAVSDIPTPVIQVRLANGDAGNLPVSAAPGGREFTNDAYGLPDSVLARLQSAPGDGRVETVLFLFSRSVLDLTLKDGALLYE